SAAGSGTASGSASPALVAAVADIDHDLAPVLKLDVHPRVVALAKLQPALLTKVQTLASAARPRVSRPAPGTVHETTDGRVCGGREACPGCESFGYRSVMTL